jgi:hypothetical protein
MALVHLHTITEIPKKQIKKGKERKKEGGKK